VATAAGAFYDYFADNNPERKSSLVFSRGALGATYAAFLHSRMVLSISAVLFNGFKISIHGESHLLRRSFGEEYEMYVKSVNEIIPFPRYLLRERVSHAVGVVGLKEERS
jgi:hypothetical protein